MTEPQSASLDPTVTISPQERRLVYGWAILLLLFFAGTTYWGTDLLSDYADQTLARRQAKLEELTENTGSRTEDASAQAGLAPVNVQIGLTLDRVSDIALRESGWTADFVLQFRWTGDSIYPGDGFRIVNGQIVQRERVMSYVVDGVHHESYRVVARMIKKFSASRFPFSDEGMTIQIEDASDGASAIHYVADELSSGFRNDALPGDVVVSDYFTRAEVVEQRILRNDMAADIGESDRRSRFTLAMLVEPRSVAVYLRMFQALFASIAISFLVLFIKPVHVDPRFGLPVGAFFAAVGNNIFVSTLLPYSDRITLADLINMTGVFTIFLVLIQSTISLYLFDTLGRERLARFFDHVSIAALFFGYILLNVMLPCAAMTN